MKGLFGGFRDCVEYIVRVYRDFLRYIAFFFYPGVSRERGLYPLVQELGQAIADSLKPLEGMRASRIRAVCVCVCVCVCVRVCVCVKRALYVFERALHILKRIADSLKPLEGMSASRIRAVCLCVCVHMYV